MDAETTQSDTFYKLMAWLHANRKRILAAVIAVAVIALVTTLVSWRKAMQDADANAHLFAIPGLVGMAARQGPISPAPLFDLAKEYPHTPGGEYALLLGAEKLFVLGKYPESQQEFAQFLVDYPDSPLIPDARMGVAASVEGEGKTPEAIQKYQELLSAFPGESQIVSPAKLTLARLLEQENQPQTALAYYSQLAQTQNPYDPWAVEARERGQLLLAKHPELKKTETAPAAAPFSLTQPAAKSTMPPTAKAPPAPPPAPAPAKPKSALNLLQFPAPSSNAAPK
jgi:TolA-binding protein